MSSKSLLISFILLSAAAHSAMAAPDVIYEDSYCANNGNYTNDSLYRAKLQDLLQRLSLKIGDSGFYSEKNGEVSALALCRADIQLHECRGCVGAAVDDILRLCPNQKQAIRWTQYCMVRHTNEMIIDNNFPSFPLCNPKNATSPHRFREVRDALFNDLWSEAADGGSLMKAAVGSRTAPDNQTIYALVQCAPDLSRETCFACFTETTPLMPELYNDTIGMKFYRASCVTYFEVNAAYNVSRVQEPRAVPAPPPSGKNNDTKRKIIIAVTSIAIVCLILAVSVGICAIKRRKLKTKGNPDMADEITVESIQYDFGKIRTATNDFSDDNKLGQGGFGVVYKGELENGQEIAVKRLSNNSGQGDLEFKNEVILVVRLQHKNLVRLLGFSTEGTERLLVYDFVRNGSLDRFLFDPMKRSKLDWDCRYKIICGTVKGLLYLHEDSRLRIIHRDLKASNILLDEQMNPKISDFGMAKLIVPDETTESTTRIVGTYGYMAPEYVSHGQFSVKSDVFSFGVLVLEIVSGQKRASYQNEESSEDLLSHAWRCWREGTMANMIDPNLMAISRTQLEVLRCIHIALLCVQENAVNRPTIASVSLMLNGFSSSLPVPLKPASYIPNTSTEASALFQEHKSRELEFTTPSNRKVVQSNNEVTITELGPR